MFPQHPTRLRIPRSVFLVKLLPSIQRLQLTAGTATVHNHQTNSGFTRVPAERRVVSNGARGENDWTARIITG